MPLILLPGLFSNYGFISNHTYLSAFVLILFLYCFTLQARIQNLPLVFDCAGGLVIHLSVSFFLFAQDVEMKIFVEATLAIALLFLFLVGGKIFYKEILLDREFEKFLVKLFMFLIFWGL